MKAAAATARMAAHDPSARRRPGSLLAATGLLVLLTLAAAAFSPALLGADPATRVARLAATAITALAILLAVVAADRLVDRGAPRLPTYAAAVVAGALAGAWFGWPLREALGLRFAFQGRAPSEAVAAFSVFHRIDQVLLGTLMGGLATIVHVNRRTALAARRRQHEAERARARAQRRTIESQLQALQARVEPVFLFDTLERIRQLYRRNPAAAGAMMEDLIVYLRAALPHLRDSSSTAAQEARLARSWLDIVGRSAPGWRFDIEVAEAARGARLPALVLLPLVQCAVAEAAAAPVLPLHLQLRVHAPAGRLRVDIATSTAAFASGIAGRPLLEQIDQRLRALYGAQAAFETGAAGGGAGSAACIELPLETTDTDDPGAPP